MTKMKKFDGLIVEGKYKGDYLVITSLKKYIEISIHQDNNGFIVKILKDDLKEILK